MRRRRRDEASAPATSHQDSRAIPITFGETDALVAVFEHAYTRIRALSDADAQTLARASGSALIPVLYARVGLASCRRRSVIPLLTEELSALEAAVVNLQSYGGNEVVLCTGHDLLDEFSGRRENTRPLSYEHGILAYADGAEDLPVNQPLLP